MLRHAPTRVRNGAVVIEGPGSNVNRTKARLVARGPGADNRAHGASGSAVVEDAHGRAATAPDLDVLHVDGEPGVGRVVDDPRDRALRSGCDA